MYVTFLGLEEGLFDSTMIGFVRNGEGTGVVLW